MSNTAGVTPVVEPTCSRLYPLMISTRVSSSLGDDEKQSFDRNWVRCMRPLVGNSQHAASQIM